MSKILDSFGARGTFDTGSGSATIYRLSKLVERGVGHVDKLPFSIKILLENALRNLDNFQVNEEAVTNIANWDAKNPKAVEIPFKPARVILQDFTGVPAVVDLAALRSAMARMGGDPQKINPIIPVDLVIDHSVQVDVFGSLDAIALKALRKRPERRYRSVHLLAEDIRRHLDGYPVAARPDSRVYRMSRFIRRHTIGFAATVAMRNDAQAISASIITPVHRSDMTRVSHELGRARLETTSSSETDAPPCHCVTTSTVAEPDQTSSSRYARPHG